MIMEIVRCSKGHFYDSEENSTCPMCAAEAARNGRTPLGDDILPTDFFGHTTPSVGDAPGATMPVNPDGGKVQPYQPTASAGSREAHGMGAYPKTEPVPMDTGATEEHAAFDPVVGWLVCIEGATKGRDYRIHSQCNYIGRSANMDISIPEDPHISGERSAQINYVDRTFFFGPVQGRNVVRVNEKPIFNVDKIEAYDVLTVGTTKLLFVPLCGDRFDWNEKN